MIKDRMLIWVLATLLIIVIVSMTVTWYKGNRIDLPTTTYVVPSPISKAAKIKTVYVPGPTKILTIEKPVVVEKLKLPDWVKDDPNKQVIATAVIPPYKGTTNTVAVLDTSTGKGDIIAKRVPLSLIGFESDKEVGIRTGMNQNIQMEVDIYGRWNFLRIGNIHIGTYAEGNSNGEAKVLLNVGYKW